MLYSVIDIGSNTVKCQVYSTENGCVKPYKFFTKQLGLIAKIKDGVLCDTAITELIDTVNEFKSNTESKVYCFATESLRKVSNLEYVKERIMCDCSLELELISGKDEALLSFEGFRSNSPAITEGIMVDMGGGSTEILKFENSCPIRLNSFKFGCLSLRKEYVSSRFPSESEIADIKNHVAVELGEHSWINNTDRLCLIGGTGSAIGKLAIELGYADLPEFDTERFMELFEYLSKPDDRIASLLEKYIPARIETIIPGMCAYKEIIETVNSKKIFISKGGIRDGYISRKLRG